MFTAEWVAGLDGTRLRAYATGPADGPVVGLVPACGMPIELVGFWLTELADAGYRVLSWETGGLFGDAQDRATLADAYLSGPPAARVAAQAGDLLAVLDHFGARQARLIALCGGAVIALAAAASRPDLIDAVSLWHADFLAGGPDSRTQHQSNLAAVLELGGQSPAMAESVHEVLCRSMSQGVPRDLAHLVLHPYGSPELLYRYCRINGAIMALPAEELLPGLLAPVLVVTSADDGTAHPGASAAVARGLARAELVVRPHGDHIGLFRGSPELLALAVGFLRQPAEQALSTAQNGTFA